jgi:hypothetical protein
LGNVLETARSWSFKKLFRRVVAVADIFDSLNLLALINEAWNVTTKKINVFRKRRDINI